MAGISVCVGDERHPGCGAQKPARARGLCVGCWRRYRALGFQTPGSVGAKRLPPRECAVCGTVAAHYARGMCKPCWRKDKPGPDAVCVDCGVIKPHQAKGRCKQCYMRDASDRLSARRRGKGRWGKDHARKYPTRDPVKSRSATVLSRYGLSPSGHESLLKAQGGRCALCVASVGFNSPVDHCHLTHRVRGVLCRTCNLTLGHAKDSPDLLRRAADYLESAVDWRDNA